MKCTECMDCTDWMNVGVYECMSSSARAGTLYVVSYHAAKGRREKAGGRLAASQPSIIFMSTIHPRVKRECVVQVDDIGRVFYSRCARVIISIPSHQFLDIMITVVRSEGI
jgi:hypothetical protein